MIHKSEKKKNSTGDSYYSLVFKHRFTSILAH